MDPSLLA
ncbi:unnamed protein product, partial [Rotaria magnacalcarata]